MSAQLSPIKASLEFACKCRVSEATFGASSCYGEGVVELSSESCGLIWNAFEALKCEDSCDPELLLQCEGTAEKYPELLASSASR